MKKYILIIFPILLTSCWFNPNDKAWIDPIVMKFSEYDFKTERDSTDWYMTYIGEQKTVSYMFADTKEWLSIENHQGNINKNEQKLLKIYIDRDKLTEGINVDTIKVFINEKHERHIIIKATGDAALEITPNEIDFGSSLASANLSIKSLCGRRTFLISPCDKWISINSPTYTTIDKNETISFDVLCDRSVLDAGKHQGSINIKSINNQFNKNIPINITILDSSPHTGTFGCYIFTIKKAYRHADNEVKVEFDIENTSNIYQTLRFNTTAFDNNNNSYKPTPYNSSLNIKKKSTDSITITFNNIPQDLTFFESLVFTFDNNNNNNNNNNQISFNNINF